MFGLPELIGGTTVGLAASLLTPRRALGFAGGLVFGATTVAALTSPTEAPPGPEMTPREEFVTSSTCRSCHPGEYDSWHSSFHRTMTQLADGDSVLGEFTGTLTTRGVSVELRSDGDTFEARLGDDSAPNAADLFLTDEWTRIVMTTGSHHMQAYWIETDDGYFSQLPFMWVIDDARWIPTDDSFIRPHADMLQDYDWLGCAQCHVTDHSPREQVGGELDFRVTELGIACEACHGPAEAHVAANQNPIRRYGLHFGDGRDPSVVEPASLDASLASQLCGQCHARVLPVDEDYARHLGTTYRAGDPLDLHFQAIENDGDHWTDGRWRVAGREWNSMSESACASHGEMTCLSCHSMHGYDSASDQLAPTALGDGACTSCHASTEFASEDHTRHAPDSEGSRCVNCHMPRTSYALYTAIADHHVASPAARPASESDRPNACNLCHLDRSLGWTADRLSEWYGQTRPALDPAEERDATGQVWALSGDAVQRAIVGWHLGYGPAIEASGSAWMRVTLAWMLDDPYAAVRYVAERSLEEHGEDVGNVDVFADADVRAAHIIRFIEDVESAAPETMRVDVGRERVRALRAARDDTDIWLAE